MTLYQEYLKLNGEYMNKLFLKLLTIIREEPNSIDSIFKLHDKEFVKQLCLQKKNYGWTLFMYVCQYQPIVVNAILDYFKDDKDFVKQLCLHKKNNGWTLFMNAVNAI